MLKVYTYAKCDSCRKALKFLRDRNISFEEFAIRETPPTHSELEAMLKARGNIRSLFNTSGADYKALGLSKRLSEISEAGASGFLRRTGT